MWRSVKLYVDQETFSFNQFILLFFVAQVKFKIRCCLTLCEEKQSKRRRREGKCLVPGIDHI